VVSIATVAAWHTCWTANFGWPRTT